MVSLKWPSMERKASGLQALSRITVKKVDPRANYLVLQMFHIQMRMAAFPAILFYDKAKGCCNKLVGQKKNGGRPATGVFGELMKWHYKFVLVTSTL